MVRVKRGNVARKRRKKVLFLAKGFRGSHSKLFRIAHGQVLKALRYSYVGRKQKKTQFRQLWITRINAMTREFCSLKYSNFMSKLKIAKISLNRKMLAQLSILDTMTFLSLKEKIFI
jgi:large subunit ribosomal protein L20